MKKINFNTMRVETREGASSFIMVMFFSMLIGIVMVGFISIMISNIMSSSDFDLSQSAYDSSLAGIEDAKIMLIKYNDCMSGGTNTTGCEDILNAMNAAGSDDDCNVIGKALGRISMNDDEIYETPIQSTYSSNNAATDFAQSLDQAYTCVKVDPTVDEYLGTITSDSDYKFIPLRTSFATVDDKGKEIESPVKYVEISWFNNADYEAVRQYKTNTSITNATGDSDNKRTGNDVQNNFTEESTYSPSLQVGLIQAPVGGYTIDSFQQNKNSNTNRGLIVFRPFESGNVLVTNIIENFGNGNNNKKLTGFSASAISGSEDWSSNIFADNSPYEVQCSSTADGVEGASQTFSNHEYACRVVIELPGAVGANSSSNKRVSDAMRYLTITTPYEDIQTSFSIKMYGDGNTGTCKIKDGALDGCVVKQFAGVQSRVDSTGRANDLFRRVEARVELVDVNYPFPKYALGTYCEGTDCDGDEGKVLKNYWASSNCFTLINGVNRGCGNGDLSQNQDYTQSATTGF